jgi:cytochrome b561
VLIYKIFLSQRFSRRKTETFLTTVARRCGSRRSGAKYALYALMLTQPILGLLHTNAHGDRANLFFLGQLPALIGQDRPLAKQLLKVHETVGLLLLGLIALHASAALYHHFWRRDDTLEAMLPQGMRRRVARRSSTGISSRARPKLPPAPGNAG